MIDTSAVEETIDSIQVEPSNNIFSELGNNTYDYKDIISELIDNSIAKKKTGELLKIIIHVYVKEESIPVEFQIIDNASGIAASIFGAAIAPAGIQTKNSLHEHGLGMKQAVAALGKLNYLATKTSGEKDARLVKEFKFGQIPVFRVPFDKDSGTEISVVDLKPIVNINASAITRTLIPYLGARYRRYLIPGNLQVEIKLKFIKQEDRKTVTNEWTVEQVKPSYLHPGTRENRPVISAHPIAGDGWSAQLTFGYAPKGKEEYEELGLPVPTKFQPYNVALKNQGLDIILHERVILFHQLSELEIVQARHNDYNDVRGEITLLTGFSTAITKNTIIHDRHFKECVDKIQKILNGDEPGPGGAKKNYLERKAYPDELPETLLRDRLAAQLKTNPMYLKTTVNTEYVVQGIEGYIDIMADNEAWELKVDQAQAKDVYQLFMYMDVGKINKGYLVARGFSTGATVAKQYIMDNHKKELILIKRDQLPINQPPSADEREEYFK